ncbi:MAG: peptide-methionine (S)-S-oxide reductase [Saonia sp.]
MGPIQKIAFGGGCHWCTEAIFKSLKGVRSVEQGFVASEGENDTFSEAVIVSYDKAEIRLEDLIAIHVHTHKSTVDHSMRTKYRSAVYTFTASDRKKSAHILIALQKDFKEHLITKVLAFRTFKPSHKMFHDYYYSDPEKPFCTSYIVPKLQVLLDRFSTQVDDRVLRSNRYSESGLK